MNIEIISKSAWKVTLFTSVVLLLAGCNEPSMSIGWRNRIPPDKAAEAAEWIVKAVAAPAPADKDPEDRLSQATDSALIIFGRTTIGVFVTDRFVPYEDTQGPARAMLDEYLKAPVAEKP